MFSCGLASTFLLLYLATYYVVAATCQQHSNVTQQPCGNLVATLWQPHGNQLMSDLMLLIYCRTENYCWMQIIFCLLQTINKFRFYIIANKLYVYYIYIYKKKTIQYMLMKESLLSYEWYILLILVIFWCVTIATLGLSSFFGWMVCWLILQLLQDKEILMLEYAL